MKINPLDAHDRLLHFKKQSDDISTAAEECIKNRPPEFLDYPFYVFAHKRQLGLDTRIQWYNKDFENSILYGTPRKYERLEDVETDQIIWQPRLTKPKAQSNSMLFRVDPKTDTVEIVWIIPQEELWDTYDKGKMTENPMIFEFIELFKKNRKFLERPFEDDLPDHVVDQVYKAISQRLNKEGKKKPELILPELDITDPH